MRGPPRQRRGRADARSTERARGRAELSCLVLPFRRAYGVSCRARALRYAACGTAIRPCGRRAALVPPLSSSDGGDSALNARPATKVALKFLQMQAFLQRAGYVPLPGVKVG